MMQGGSTCYSTIRTNELQQNNSNHYQQQRRVIFPSLHNNPNNTENESDSNTNLEGADEMSSGLNLPMIRPLFQKDSRYERENSVSQDDTGTTEQQQEDEDLLQATTTTTDSTTDDQASTTPVTSNKRPSILRSSRFSSETSILDSPSLSSSTISSCSSLETTYRLSPPLTTRSVSAPTLSFDPQIWVREFRRTPEELRTTWFSSDELNAFKSATLLNARRHSSGEPLLFSHPALQHDEDDDDDPVRHILIVDPHDICSNLFAKGLRLLFPHATITQQRRHEIPKNTTSTNPYDIIVCEERWQLLYRPHTTSTGSAVLQHYNETNENCCLIGTSAHMAQDRAVLQAAGADLTWSKPPPRMDAALRETILRVLASKKRQS